MLEVGVGSEEGGGGGGFGEGGIHQLLNISFSFGEGDNIIAHYTSIKLLAHMLVTLEWYTNCRMHTY